MKLRPILQIRELLPCQSQPLLVAGGYHKLSPPSFLIIQQPVYQIQERVWRPAMYISTLNTSLNFMALVLQDSCGSPFNQGWDSRKNEHRGEEVLDVLYARRDL